jgi:hypothetical protein
LKTSIRQIKKLGISRRKKHYQCEREKITHQPGEWSFVLVLLANLAFYSLLLGWRVVIRTPGSGKTMIQYSVVMT